MIERILLFCRCKDGTRKWTENTDEAKTLRVTGKNQPTVQTLKLAWKEISQECGRGRVLWSVQATDGQDCRQGLLSFNVFRLAALQPILV